MLAAQVAAKLGYGEVESGIIEELRIFLARLPELVLALFGYDTLLS